MCPGVYQKPTHKYWTVPKKCRWYFKSLVWFVSVNTWRSTLLG
jgi:hypothetical protein